MMTGADLLTIERTLQLAIAPAFVIGGIMALLSLLVSRLQRLWDLERDLAGDPDRRAQHAMLRRRAEAIYRSVTAAVLAAAMIALLVIVSFVEPVFGIGAGTHVVGLLIIGMALLILSLLLLFWEVLLSARAWRRGEP